VHSARPKAMLRERKPLGAPGIVIVVCLKKISLVSQ
jgi:hypothetical protein